MRNGSQIAGTILYGDKSPLRTCKQSQIATRYLSRVPSILQLKLRIPKRNVAFLVVVVLQRMGIQLSR